MSEQVEKNVESPFIAKGRKLPKYMSRLETDAYLNVPGRVCVLRNCIDDVLYNYELKNGEGSAVFSVKVLDAFISADRALKKKLDEVMEEAKKDFAEAVAEFAEDYDKVEDYLAIGQFEDDK